MRAMKVRESTVEERDPPGYRKKDSVGRAEKPTCSEFRRKNDEGINHPG